MTYVLSLWLIMAGQMIGLEARIPASADCAATAVETAAANGAALVEFRCVLEIGV